MALDLTIAQPVPWPAAVLAGAAAEDPHIEWWAEAERLNIAVEAAADAGDDARANELTRCFDQLYRLCVDTTAHTLAGMAVVINMVALKEQIGVAADQSDREAMLRVAAALQRMARRACQ
jgi:hypothetical protein